MTPYYRRYASAPCSVAADRSGERWAAERGEQTEVYAGASFIVELVMLFCLWVSVFSLIGAPPADHYLYLGPLGVLVLICGLHA